MSDPRSNTKPPRVVAELGRPETPDETAARKAENSRAHRANQTTRNLILALLASLVVVLFTVLVVVRPDQATPVDVNWTKVAQQSQQGITDPLVAPSLSKSWKANDAEVKPGPQTGNVWYIGFITPKQQFIALEQGVDQNDAWVGSLLGQVRSTGHTTIEGIDWTIYDQRTASNAGNFQYSMTATFDATHYVLHGSASKAEFVDLAGAVGTFVTSAHSTAN
jgi:hypothetical protein